MSRRGRRGTQADPFLDYARLAATPQAPAVIAGRALEVRREFAEEDVEYHGFANVPVTAAGSEKKEMTALSDENGYYALVLPSGGTFAVSAQLPPSVLPAAPKSITVGAGECEFVQFSGLHGLAL